MHTYSKAFDWLISEVEIVILLWREAIRLLDFSKRHTFHGFEQQNHLEKISQLYKSVLKHEALLSVLMDYLPNHMILRLKEKTKDQMGNNISHGFADIERMSLFFEELGSVLDVLNKHCRTVKFNMRINRLHNGCLSEVCCPNI